MPKSTTTYLLLGEGFVKQLGKNLFRLTPPNAETFKVIWIGVDPGNDAGSRLRVNVDGSVGVAVLEALGQSTELLNDVTAAINDALNPRFDDAILSSTDFFCYDSATDLEMHLPVTEVKEHFDRGNLREWLQALADPADLDNA